MNLHGILHFLLSGLAVLLASYLFSPKIRVDHYGYALLVALLISLANAFLKPILVVLTIPITVLTLGLFLLVINGLIISLVGWITPGFYVKSFGWAVLFSIVLTLFQSALHALLRGPRP